MHIYRRISTVLFPVMTIALILTAIWGYNEYSMRNKIMVKAENQYQRSFHDLSYHMDRLHAELGNTLAMSSASTDSYRKGLVNIWRLTSEARSEVSQLPLVGMDFNKTNQFLANVANFSYRAGIRDFGKKPLDDKELKTLDALYTHSDQITKDMRALQSKVLANGLRWAEVEMALSNEKGPHDNAIVDGFQSMEKQVSGYSDVEWDPVIAGIHERNDGSKLEGKEVTADEVRTLAAKFLGVAPGNVNVVENGKNTKIRTYTATIGSDGKITQIDFTSKGGHPFYLSSSRQLGAPTKDINHAVEAGQQFLNKREYKDMTPVSYDHEGNKAVDITFTRKMNETLIYPEEIVLKVALDNAEIVGMQASDYVFNHRTREPKAPEMTIAEARKNINKNVKITKEALALIKNDLKEDTVCYEFTGKMNNTTYRIYINADTGSEEKIETIEPDDAKPL